MFLIKFTGSDIKIGKFKLFDGNSNIMFKRIETKKNFLSDSQLFNFPQLIFPFTTVLRSTKHNFEEQSSS
jgi:hypothetical protein